MDVDALERLLPSSLTGRWASLAAKCGRSYRPYGPNDEQLNWRELCARVDELASSFAVQGVVEGSGVRMRCGRGNTPQTLLAWLALPQCGGRGVAREPSAAATAA